MKPTKRQARLAARQKDYEAFMAKLDSKLDEGPRTRRRTGGYHRPGSVTK